MLSAKQIEKLQKKTASKMDPVFKKREEVETIALNNAKEKEKKEYLDKIFFIKKIISSLEKKNPGEFVQIYCIYLDEIYILSGRTTDDFKSRRVLNSSRKTGIVGVPEDVFNSLILLEERDGYSFYKMNEELTKRFTEINEWFTKKWLYIRKGVISGDRITDKLNRDCVDGDNASEKLADLSIIGTLVQEFCDKFNCSILDFRTYYKNFEAMMMRALRQ